MNSDLRNIINSENVPNFFFLFGEEEFLIEKNAKFIISQFIRNDSDRFNYDSFDGEDADQLHISSIAGSFPMMSKRRVIFIKNFHKLFSPRGSKKDENLPISKYLKSPSPDTVMILTDAPDSLKGFQKLKNDPKKLASKIKALRFPFNLLLEKAYWIEFPKIYESELKSWTITAAKEKKLKFANGGIDLLLSQTNPNLREIDNELNKISVFLNDDNREITIDEISFLKGSTRDYNVFELQKAVGERNIKQSLNILLNMQKHSDQSILITTMIFKYFSTLFVLSDEIKTTNNEYVLAPKIGTSPYFVKDYIKALKKYSPIEIDYALIYISEADLQLKTSSGSKISILQDMLIKILSA